MNEVTRENKINNMRSSIGMASIVDKLNEKRLRWFKHFMRREKTDSKKIKETCY